MLNGPLPDEGQRRERGVDQAVLGIEEEDPAQGHGEARQEEGRPERELDPAPAGQVRPREQPGDEHGERQRQELPDEGDGERVPERAAQSRLAEGGAPAVEPVARRLARRRHLKALQDDEEEGEDHAEGDEGEDDGAEHRLRLDAAGARQGGGLAQAGHTLTSSGGKASCRPWPSRHSGARGKRSRMLCSPPSVTRASYRSPTKRSVSMTPGSA